jgi:hypothetical protein
MLGRRSSRFVLLALVLIGFGEARGTGTSALDTSSPNADAQSVALGAERERSTRESGSNDRLGHWSFREIERPIVPSPRLSRSARQPLDLFVLAGLEASGLEPSPEAERATLLLRLHLDLLGLPPSPDEIAAFVSDSTEDAYERLVDRLLGSPHYAERQARHWLDVARYADTNGADENMVHSLAYRYRDWVVGAFDRDLPFARFIEDQIAGDMRADSRPTRAIDVDSRPPTLAREDLDFDESETTEALTATGFLLLGPKILAEPDKLKMRMDIIDEQVDVTSKAFLALSFGCARCHDHKFDPISARDYYAVAGVFHGTKSMESWATVAKWLERPLAGPRTLQALSEQTTRADELAREIDALGTVGGDESDARRRAELVRARDTLLAEIAGSPRVMAVAEDERPIHLPILARGDHEAPTGDPIPRGAPSFLDAVVPREPVPDSRSGRAEFARWLAHPRNPLPARVWVNRVFGWRFGRGLVRTPDDFGRRGEAPSHPELLDWLASEFIEQGGSTKDLVRMMVLSSTYRQSSRFDRHAAAIDPEERLWWRFPPRRLEAEAIRDRLFAASGELDLRIGGSLVSQPSHEYYRQGNFETSSRRALYLPVVRNGVGDIFAAFDAGTPEVTVGERPRTIVVQQALWLLENALVRDRARALAHRVLSSVVPAAAADSELSALAVDDERIRLALVYALGRPASVEEVSAARLEIETLGAVASREDAWAAWCHALLGSNEFLYLR